MNQCVATNLIKELRKKIWQNYFLHKRDLLLRTNCYYKQQAKIKNKIIFRLCYNELTDKFSIRALKQQIFFKKLFFLPPNKKSATTE
jgi:hypothetical protein